MKPNLSLSLLTICVAAFVAAGCSTASSQMPASAATTTEIAEKERQISSQQQEIDRLQRELQSSQSQPKPAIPAGMSADLFPPNPKAGECYARVLIPATYATASETVLIKEASERVEIIPARYETAEERVLVKEASSRLEIVPATYKTVEDRILVKPESVRIEEIPATYKTKTERVLVSPARTEWKRGAASGFSNVVDTRSTDTGEIMCLVEVPAVYRDVSTTVIDQPARTQEIKIPAEYRTVKKQVLATPATTREITIPAEYGMVKTTKLVAPPKENRIAIPAAYDTVTKRTKKTEEILEWRQVVCDVNLNRDNIASLQRALQSKNQYEGPIDGILGPMTLSGANAYAKSNGLPTGDNYIAQSVIEKLNLKF